MSEAYRKVVKKESIPQNEIRVKKERKIGKYLLRAHDLLNDKKNPKDSVVIKGVSHAIQSAINLAELIKHKVKGLHQINKIINITIVDEYEPLFEGLDFLTFSRDATMLEITLTKTVSDDD
jgi:DNA-binding protein